MSPYEYSNHENSTPKIVQQDQGSAARYAAEPIRQPHNSVPTHQRTQLKSNARKPEQGARMPKALALALAEKVKKGIVVTSLLLFGTFSGLVAYRQTTEAALQTASQAASGSSTTPTATATQDSSSSYFNQGSSTSAATNTRSSSASSASTGNNSGSNTSTTTTTAPSTSTTVS